MPKAKSAMMQVVAQREALLIKQSMDSSYESITRDWEAQLTTVEKEALRIYDHLVEEYLMTLPALAIPTKPIKVH